MAWPTTVTPIHDVPAIRHAFGPDATDSPVFEPTRQFAAGDYIKCTIGGLAAIPDALTVAVIVRIQSQPATDAAMLSFGDGTSDFVFGIRRGKVALEIAGQDGVSTESLDFDDHWRLIVADTSGAYWVYDFTDQEWDNNGVDGLVGDMGTFSPDSGGNFVFGQTVAGLEPLGFDIAAAAVWQAEIDQPVAESLIAVDELRDWADILHQGGGVAPAGTWMFGQTNISRDVEDITGSGADQTARSGTRVLSEPPPIEYGRDVETITVEVEGGSRPPTVGQLFPRGM